MTEEESAPLLAFLFRHQVSPSSPAASNARGLAAFWDNRCAQHNPVNDYHGHRRVMHRITLAGERPAKSGQTTFFRQAKNGGLSLIFFRL